MLHKPAYQEFMTLLKDWQKVSQNPDSKGIPENFSQGERAQQQIAVMTKEFSKIQQFFQQEIITLTDQDLDQTTVTLWRTLQPEIQREFRLLSTDVLFLTSSRQASTREKRLKLIGERTTKLIAYCHKISDSIES